MLDSIELAALTSLNLKILIKPCPQFPMLWPIFISGQHSLAVYTVRKMDLILRSIERRPQMQFSMARCEGAPAPPI